MLRLTLFKWLLRLPRFPGSSRLVTGYRRLFLRPALTRCHGDVLLRLDPWEWTQAELLRDGTLEPATVRLFERLLGPGDTVVDVGAHVGFFALVARRAVGSEGRVVAIDPQPENCARCLANFRLNGFENLTVIPAAAADRASWLELPDQSPTDRARLTLAGDGVNDEGRRIRVRCLALADLMEDLGIASARLVKIDVRRIRGTGVSRSRSGSRPSGEPDRGDPPRVE